MNDSVEGRNSVYQGPLRAGAAKDSVQAAFQKVSMESDEKALSEKNMKTHGRTRGDSVSANGRPENDVPVETSSVMEPDRKQGKTFFEFIQESLREQAMREAESDDRAKEVVAKIMVMAPLDKAVRNPADNLQEDAARKSDIYRDICTRMGKNGAMKSSSALRDVESQADDFGKDYMD